MVKANKIIKIITLTILASFSLCKTNLRRVAEGYNHSENDRLLNNALNNLGKTIVSNDDKYSYDIDNKASDNLIKEHNGLEKVLAKKQSIQDNAFVLVSDTTSTGKDERRREDPFGGVNFEQLSNWDPDHLFD